MPEKDDFTELILRYAHLTSTLLHTSFLHLSRSLVMDDGIDFAVVPAPVRHSYEELLFGGLLFQCEPFTPYEIRTAFHVFFAVMQLDGTHGFIAIGPYLPEEAPADELEALLVQGQIPLEEKPLYASYLQTLPVLPQPKLQAVLDAFALHLNGKKIDPLQRSLELTPENPSPCPVFDEDSLQARADMLALRYQRENEFLDAILRGDTGALRIMRPVNLNRLPNKLRNEKNQMFILNTLLRKAIESAHVHPYYIDQISAKWAVRLENAASLNELSQLTTDLVDDYSRLVQRHSLAHYTPTVRTMINFVNFNLSNPALTLQMIAEAMGASQSYLSRQFNKETGSSLPEFIKGQRIAQAKQLLRRSELLSIGQISVATGFSDMNYFAKVFRHATGMTPTEYRRGNKKSKPGAGARGEL